MKPDIMICFQNTKYGRKKFWRNSVNTSSDSVAVMFPLAEGKEQASFPLCIFPYIPLPESNQDKRGHRHKSRDSLLTTKK